jgi:hypothetical protein
MLTIAIPFELGRFYPDFFRKFSAFEARRLNLAVAQTGEESVRLSVGGCVLSRDRWA